MGNKTARTEIGLLTARSEKKKKVVTWENSDNTPRSELITNRELDSELPIDDGINSSYSEPIASSRMSSNRIMGSLQYKE